MPGNYFGIKSCSSGIDIYDGRVTVLSDYNIADAPTVLRFE